MRNSFTSCSRGAAGFVGLFLAVVSAALAFGEWELRQSVYSDDEVGVVASRIGAVYERRVWPVLGDSRLGNALVGDSQLYLAFRPDYPGFLHLGLSGESTPMLEILVKEYFKFRAPGRVIVEAGPQLFSQRRLDFGTLGYDRYFKQNNWVQHALGIWSYMAEPGVSNNIGPLLQHKAARYQPEWMTAALAPATAAEAPTPEHWGLYPLEERLSYARQRVAVQRPVDAFEQTSHFAAYRRTIEFLAEKKATLCVLRTPLTEEYLQLIRDDPHYLQAYAAIQALAKVNGARYVDSQMLPITYSPENFDNQDHLNARGGALFAPVAEKACFS